MKKVTLLLVCGLFLNLSGFAADGTSPKDNRALQATRKLSTTLQLNERTFIQVKELQVSKYQEMDKAIVMFGNDAKLKDAKLQEIEKRYNDQISALLTPTQKSNFAAYLSNAQNTSGVSANK